jgi:Tol biopolymer transport system component
MRFNRLPLICITFLWSARLIRLPREEQALARNNFYRWHRLRERSWAHSARLVGCILLAFVAAGAQRPPVLPQIDVPYRLYYREMYLPQLTSGPSSVAWMPDSESVIFSMQGSLWRQRLDSSTAEQLTDGRGYDYQPDVSPDGRWVIYAKYNQDAIELWLLDLSNRQSKQLTQTGAVNVEPRWSPAFAHGDARIVFVSSDFNRHFHIFVAQFDATKRELKEVQRLTAETRSNLPRTLYGVVDHEISPAWSPDGKEIIFVSNHNRADGAGGLWRMKSVPVLMEAPPPVPRGPFGMMSRRLPPIVKEESHQVLDEKTTCRARPDWSPDGKRVIYAMYHAAPNGGGRYELRTVSADDGQAQMPSDLDEDYNDFNPRWSPDGKQIAFISTRSGKFSLWVRDDAGAHQREIMQKERKFLSPKATIRFQSGTAAGPTGSASIRVSISGEDGRAYAPDGAMIYAEDGFDRKERPLEAYYFDLNILRSRPSEAVTVPQGKIHVEITRGLEYRPVSIDVELKGGEDKVLPVKLRPLHLPESPAVHWLDGDLHVGMDFGGAYRNPTQILLGEMKAEDLSVAANLMANNGEQIPDIRMSRVAGRTAQPSAARQILYGEQFQSAFWGDVDLLNTNPPLIPKYFSFPTRPPGLLPTNADIADQAQARAYGKKPLVGYTHLFQNVPDPNYGAKLTHELPLDVALGKVDYYAAVGPADPKSSATVWYSLLNLGFRLPVAAGSDAVAGYVSSRGPVGRDRVYVRVLSGPLKVDSWLDGLRRGHSFATNGPLLRFTLGGQQVGGELKLPAPKTVRFSAALRSIVPVDHLEIVCNGEVALRIPLNQARDASNAVGGLHLGRSGWCLLRAWADQAEHPVLDDYPYATTSPIYVTVAGSKPRSPEDASYFMTWMEHMKENAQANAGYRNEAEKTRVLNMIDSAHKVYEQLAK